MSLPSLFRLSDSLLRPWNTVTKLDALVRLDDNGRKPLRTRSQLEAALLLVKSHIDAHQVVAVGIVADVLEDGYVQVFAVEKQRERMRAQIQEVDPVSLEIRKATPLIKSQPHLYFPWTGIAGLARVWFDISPRGPIGWAP